MPIAVVLAVGFDPWLFEYQRTVWRSAGYFVTSTRSVKEAIDQFEGSDFDLVLLSDGIAAEDRERLGSLIRATGSSTPVVSVTISSSHHDAFAHSTVRNLPEEILQSVGELLARGARPSTVNWDGLIPPGL
jgi:hypothetical protein